MKPGRHSDDNYLRIALRLPSLLNLLIASEINRALVKRQKLPDPFHYVALAGLLLLELLQ